MMQNQLILRNYYWYLKGREERLRNRSMPFALDHLPPRKVLCAVII